MATNGDNPYMYWPLARLADKEPTGDYEATVLRPIWYEYIISGGIPKAEIEQP